MANFTVKIKGLKELSKKLDARGVREVTQEISDELFIKMNDIRQEAVVRVPVDQGHLRGKMRVEGRGLNWVFKVDADYADFQEFGTKTLVSIPPELKDAAVKVNSGKSSYKSFKVAIAEWMKRKGIPKEALWPIMRKIMSRGVKPQPFVYPSIKKVYPTIEPAIDKIIQDWLNR